MISITGQILNITQTEQKDRETGEIKQVFKAEILHITAGKSEVANLKLEADMVDHWRKAIGMEIQAEVKFGAMPGNQGGKPMLYMILADKKALPVLLRPNK